jgi:hypothetical protein
MQAYDYGTALNSVQAASRQGGITKGLEEVDRQVQTKQLNADQANQLHNQAVNASNTAQALYNQAVTTNFHDYMTNTDGAVPEDGFKHAVKDVPEWARDQAEKVARAEYTQAVNERDDKADSEMLAYHAAHPTDGAGLLRTLQDPQNQYGGPVNKARMKTQTYMYWEGLADRLMHTPGQGDGTTEEGFQAIDAIVRNTHLTRDEKKTKIQALGQQTIRGPDGKEILDENGNKQYVVGYKTLDNALNRATSKDYEDTNLAQAYDTVYKYVEQEAVKANIEGAAKAESVNSTMAKFNQAIQALRNEGPSHWTPDRLQDIQAAIIRGVYTPPKPTKEPIRFDRPQDMEGALRDIRAGGAKAVVSPEKAVAMQAYGVKDIADTFGGKATYLGTEPVDRQKNQLGSPIFEVKGLAEAPNVPFYFRYGLDQGGRMSKQVLDNTGNWVPATDFSTLSQRAATAAQASSKLMQKAAAAKAEQHAATITATRTLEIPEAAQQVVNDWLSPQPKRPSLEKANQAAADFNRNYGTNWTGQQLLDEGVTRGSWK